MATASSVAIELMLVSPSVLSVSSASNWNWPCFDFDFPPIILSRAFFCFAALFAFLSTFVYIVSVPPSALCLLPGVAGVDVIVFDPLSFSPNCVGVGGAGGSGILGGFMSSKTDEPTEFVDMALLCSAGLVAAPPLSVVLLSFDRFTAPSTCGFLTKVGVWFGVKSPSSFLMVSDAMEMLSPVGRGCSMAILRTCFVTGSESGTTSSGFKCSLFSTNGFAPTSSRSSTIRWK